MTAPVEPPAECPARVVFALLLIPGTIFIVMAVVYNIDVLSIIVPDLRILPRAIQRINPVRREFLLWGGVYILLALGIQYIKWLGALSRKSSVANVVLSLATIITPIVVLELALRPFAYPTGKPTTIFVRDTMLGWKLRANTVDTWKQASVRINGKGLRGKELEYAKPRNTKRILFLGDSVTFGFALEEENTFPRFVDSTLNSMMSCQIDAINAGVDGYAPWQELEYLQSEGLRYEPDLVVLSFVLNDVTEPLLLTRFGGWHEGWQLEHLLDGGSRLLYELSRKSNIVYFVRMLSVKSRFGADIPGGARERETLYAGHLAYYPQKEGVQQAWKTTLNNIGKIHDICRQHNIPLIILVFPFTFQFEDIRALSTPQQVICSYAAGLGIPAIDLLPVFNTAIKKNGTSPQEYFLDELHPSASGNRIVGDTLSSFISTNHFIVCE